MIRLLGLAWLLTACAAPAAMGGPDAGGVGMFPCHLVPAAEFEAAPKSAVTSVAVDGLSVTATGGSAACRTLDDGAAACDVRGPGYLRADSGGRSLYAHAPGDRITTVVRSPAGLSCRQVGA